MDVRACQAHVCRAGFVTLADCRTEMRCRQRSSAASRSRRQPREHCKELLGCAEFAESARRNAYNFEAMLLRREDMRVKIETRKTTICCRQLGGSVRAASHRSMHLRDQLRNTYFKQ